MNPIKRWFIERWLKSKGWTISGYPVSRGTLGYKYTVYQHQNISSSTGGIDWAIELQTRRETAKSKREGYDDSR